MGRAHLSGVLLAFVGKGGFAVCLYETQSLKPVGYVRCRFTDIARVLDIRDHHAFQLDLLHFAA